MNCEEFEEIINDLACEHLMLATRRVQALAHTEICARCAARLAKERLLTERLRLVAESEVIETPARVKASLMAAFAERNGTVAAPAAAIPIKFAPAGLAQPPASRRWWPWRVAAAAAIVVLLTVVTMRLLNAGSPVDSAPDSSTAAQAAPTPAPPESPAKQPPSSVQQSPGIVGGSGPAGRSRTPVRVAQHRQPRKPEASGVRPESAQNNEVVTDYIPLTYLNDSTAFDSGLVVRVQVPRSTLISMGLPMNVENSAELVKADVVVGDDGVARAIRFVHDSSARADAKQSKL